MRGATVEERSTIVRRHHCRLGKHYSFNDHVVNRPILRLLRLKHQHVRHRLVPVCVEVETITGGASATETMFMLSFLFSFDASPASAGCDLALAEPEGVRSAAIVR